MENAALYLMNGDRGAALDSLDAGVRAGWKDALFLERDPLLAGLRSDPRFQSDPTADRARSRRDARARRFQQSERVGGRACYGKVSAPRQRNTSINIVN